MSAIQRRLAPWRHNFGCGTYNVPDDIKAAPPRAVAAHRRARHVVDGRAAYCTRLEPRSCRQGGRSERARSRVTGCSTELSASRVVRREDLLVRRAAHRHQARDGLPSGWPRRGPFNVALGNLAASRTSVMEEGRGGADDQVGARFPRPRPRSKMPSSTRWTTPPSPPWSPRCRASRSTTASAMR
jgi:hypothetical protein